MEETKRFISSE